jgi:mRNA interferase RelE/StbE
MINTLHIERITKGGLPFIQMPKSDYDALIERMDDLEDIQAIRHAKLHEKEDTLIPIDVVERVIIDGESAVKVYREHRGFTQTQLAEASGVNRAYISEIENGKKQGSVAAVKALAEALNVAMDDLV